MRSIRGAGPGWVALGDSQQLQVQQRRKLEAIDKQVKPPMVVPSGWTPYILQRSVYCIQPMKARR
jgi:hypothetical protein